MNAFVDRHGVVYLTAEDERAEARDDRSRMRRERHANSDLEGDLSGRVLGTMTVISRAPNTTADDWRVDCDCDAMLILSRSKLRELAGRYSDRPFCGDRKSHRSHELGEQW